MKKTARLIAILLAVFLAFASMIPAFGDEEDETNTGLPTRTGSLTIHKYIMADLDYANLPNDGREVGTGTGQDSTTSIPDSADPIAGVLFDAYLLTGIIYLEGSTRTVLPIRDDQSGGDYGSNTGNVITTPLGNEQMYAILDDFDKFTFALNDYDDPTEINLLAGFYVEDDNYVDGVRTIIGFTLGQVTSGPGQNQFAFPATNAQGVAKVDNMPKGFYLVREQLDGSHRAEIASIVFPFIVAVPMTNVTGTGWIRDVHVYPKNGDISIDKYIDRNAVHTGEKVMMDVVVSIPADIRTYNLFEMTDILDECLTYVPNSLKIYGYKGTDTDPDPDPRLLDGSKDATAGLVWELFADASGTGGLAGSIVTTDPGRPAAGVERMGNPFFLMEEPSAANDNTLTVTALKQQQDNLVKSGTTTPGDNATSVHTPNTNREHNRVDLYEFWKLREYNFIRYEFEVIVKGIGDVNNDGVHEDLLDREHIAYTFENDATITFKNKFDFQKYPNDEDGRRTRTSNKVRAHSAAIVMDKIDANNNAVLEGAQFKIASTEDNARSGLFLKFLPLDPVTQRHTGNATDVMSIIDVGHPDYSLGVEILETARIPNASDIDLYHTALWDYICTNEITGVQGTTPIKAVVRFDGLKEFGQFHTGTKNGTDRDKTKETGRKYGAASTIDKDLEDQTLNSRLPDGYNKATYGPEVTSNAYLTYWIVETKTPDPPANGTGGAYNLLLEPIRVTFGAVTPVGGTPRGNATTGLATNATGTPPSNKTNYANWYTVGTNLEEAIRVRNSNRFTLPRTGGIGTILFTAGGVAIIGLGLFLFLMSMRKKKANQA